MSASLFARAQAVADAVLFEGYNLYPYRPTSQKNKYRWTFGVLAPKRWSEAEGCEAWWLEAQVLVAAPVDRTRVSARLRFLRIVDRRVQVAGEDVERLDAGDQVHVPWEEGEVREIDLVFDRSGDHAFIVEGGREEEPIAGAPAPAAGILRVKHELRGVVRARFEEAGPSLTRVCLRVENLGDFAPGTPRAATMIASFVSTHLLLAVDRATPFVSLQDPPEGAREAASASRSTGTYPVLVGDAQANDLVLAAPIILEEHPKIAPESPGDMFDGGEIDEILALRTKLLTPEEKTLVRATDARTRELLDRVESLDEEQIAKLHGAIRDRPSPAPRAPSYPPGSRVRLRPARGGRRTDAQDLLYDGHVATVEAVLDDVDGRQYLAVTVEDDPAAELNRWYGRFHHYYPDEVEPA